MRKIFTLFVAVCVMLALSATAARAQDKYVFKLGFTSEVNSHSWHATHELKRLMEEYSGGKLSIEIFPAAQLGSERDLIEGVSLGTLEMCISSTGPITNFSEDFMVLDLPYLATSRDQLFPVLDGEVGRQILATLEPLNIKPLGFWENGFRNVTNNKTEIRHPGQLKGLKIRTMENPVHQETFRVFGATPVPMAWGEVFISLQQGTIDGHENALINILNDKIYEVQKQVSLTAHFYSPFVLMINKELYDGLPGDIRDALVKAAEEAKHWERNYCIKLENQLIDDLAKLGVNVIEVDREEWRKASAPVYETFRARIKPEYLKAFGL